MSGPEWPVSDSARARTRVRLGSRRAVRLVVTLSAALATALFGCGEDSRKAAIMELVAVAEAASWDVAVIREDDYERLEIVPADSGLARYTALVERFVPDSAGSHRALYDGLAWYLYREVQILEREAPVYTELKGDTLEARILIRRPDQGRLAATVEDWRGEQRRYIGSIQFMRDQEDRGPLNEAALRTEWARRVERARKELRESDTLFIWAVPSGVIHLVTASDRRAGLAERKALDRQRAHARDLAPSVTFEEITRTDYGSPSLEGTIVPGRLGWWPAADSALETGLGYWVDCRVTDGGDTLVADTYLMPRQRHEEVDFDCNWLDGNGRRVRAFVDPGWALRFRLGGDSTSPRGPWVEVSVPRR